MAPPTRARQGFSRRARLGLFAGYVVAVSGALAALLLALAARIDPQGHAAIQVLFADLTRPVSMAGRTALHTVTSGFAGIAAYIDAGSKNRALEAEVRAARARLVAAAAVERENHRLRRLAGLVERSENRVATANLIASSGTSSRRYATLSAGATSGVANGQPVRTSEGLVGRVVAAGRASARVLLITDGGNVVPVRRVGDGFPALATGRGDGALDIRAVQASDNPFKRGDLFVTSGAGGIYPPGIPVAVGKVVTRDAIVARPLADPSRLDFAIVLAPYLSADRTLPPPETRP